MQGREEHQAAGDIRYEGRPVAYVVRELKQCENCPASFVRNVEVIPTKHGPRRTGVRYCGRCISNQLAPYQSLEEKEQELQRLVTGAKFSVHAFGIAASAGHAIVSSGRASSGTSSRSTLSPSNCASFPRARPS
jgi:hypothetical protein